MAPRQTAGSKGRRASNANEANLGFRAALRQAAGIFDSHVDAAIRNGLRPKPVSGEIPVKDAQKMAEAWV